MLRVYDKITSHLLHLQKHEKQECAYTELKALNMFVSGVGGTGKSFLIQAVRAFMRATWPDTDNTTAVGAPTGLAACNVSGMTTYQLPVEHEGKTAQYWPLPKDSLKFLRIQLKNVKVFIIDEISMVSSLNLAYIHLRLEEIFGADEWFGGKTMLLVRDILQLPPVNGTPVFQQVPNKVISLRLGSIGSVNIWKKAVLYDELTINDLLDGVRRGFPSQEALELLAQRVLDKPFIEKFNKL